MLILHLRRDMKRMIRSKLNVLSSVQLLSCVWLFETPWIAAYQASLSITNSKSSSKLMSIESVMPSSHLILCYPLLLPPILPRIRVFSNESTLRMRWPKYWSFSFSKIAATAKSLQSCPTLCDPIDGSPPGSPVPGILQARTLLRSKNNLIIV